MSDFTVLLSALDRASSSTRSVVAELETELRTLRRDADEVLTDHWHGRAATAFDRAWSRWDAGAREVVAGLARLGDLVHDTSIAYAVRDELGADQLQRAAS